MEQTLAAIRGVAWPGLAVWVAAERGRFALWLPVALGAGVLGYFQLAAEPGWWVGPVLVAGALALSGLLWRGFAGRTVAAGVLAAALGFAAGQWATGRALPTPSLPRTAVVLTGTVRAVEALPDGARVMIAGAAWPDQPGLARVVRVRLKAGDPAQMAAGDQMRVRVVLRAPEAPAYPGGWDLQREAYFSGLAGGGRALGNVDVLAQVPVQGIERLREAVAGRILAALPSPEGGIAATLMTGMGTAIPQTDRAAFRDSGLAHLLAVAGLHIGIVMGLAMGAVRWGLARSERAALFWPCKQIAAGAALAAGLGYLLLTGGHVPILRSFAMAALVTLGVALGRRALSLRGWALAAGAILLVAPWEILGVSFQMSFAAVLALIAGYEALRPWWVMREGWRHHAVALVLTSLLAGAASAPFGAYHFGQIQIYFILANVVAVPLTAMWVMPAGLLALALMPLGLERLALVPMGWGIDVILWVARHVAALPSASVHVPHMPGWGLAVVSLGLAWLCLWRSRWRLLGVGAILVGLVSGVVSPPADLLVSEDARLIAWEGRYIQTRPGFSPFAKGAWEQYWAVTLDAPFPEQGPLCDPAGCRLGGVRLARADKVVDCAGVGLVVSAEWVRAGCPGVTLIDRAAVRRDGAYAVWLQGGQAVVVSDRAARGERPWMPGPPGAAKPQVTMPLAATE